MEFNRDHLHDRLISLTPDSVGRYIVAYSGGCDSQVLLHALASLREHLSSPVLAVHVNHGLQEGAEQWAAHCVETCRSLNIPLETITLTLKLQRGESVEEIARNARYGAIRELMHNGDLLLTAHHLDDQAETLLLQLFRGAGLKGMAAMPEAIPFGPGRLVRPLLSFSRSQLEDYGEKHGLSWVEDESNLDPRYDRNFLRNSVMPKLLERWPSVKQTLARSASYCAEAQGEIDRIAADDLATVLNPEDNALSIEGVSALEPARQRSVLCMWIRESGFRAPNSRRINQIQSEVLGAGDDRNPVVSWDAAELRRYRGSLYLMPRLPYPDSSVELAWDGESELELPSGIGVLTKRTGHGGIDGERWRQGVLRVRFRQEGLKCRPAGRGISISLKKLFQEHGVPPWERWRTPLLFIDGELAAIGDLVVCEPFQAKSEEQGEWLVMTRQSRETAF
ncbi:tRNA lysidine(34) synthetase TilS [Solemya velesiana gill symbiont]|uniref:tRNA(Ile)-lysidine synthase n=1 Tax=Solemya velesiana gill symbiont TaxID=1918948 RepID=A0A1T2KW57_9GAMM|nr:tRNA lysidine(34) synthetase TilS [Solemya velesiana gill symbiont]OOZ37089.1 tRNA lysidine(34) synthetase TilS [Solemya velesiana gill symbiont]